MKLMRVDVEGYKRFEDKALLDVAPSVVALIGPNEAGKSSLLNAMLLLNSDSVVDMNTRSQGSQKPISISAHYVLDKDDRAALSAIPGGSNIKAYKYERKSDGSGTKNTYTLNPNPKRDLTARHRRATELERFVRDEAILSRFHSNGNGQVDDSYGKALDALKSTDDSLTADEIAAIRRFANVMDGFPDIYERDDDDIQTVTVYFEKFTQELSSYAEGRSPSAEAAAILGTRRPEFIFFTSADRNLLTSYNAETETVDPPKALRNLAQLAELDLDLLRDSADSSKAATRATLLVRANARLKERFKDLWPQLDLTVHIEFNQPNIEITVSAPDDSFNLVSERSDGLRAFVALRAFLSRHQTVTPPILLVDEAETHLHYDAQANLVDMFTKQTLAAKVIYSTHSAGCLPMDLGNGIRVVSPKPNEIRSEVKKSIWDGQFAGFTPLVFAMGASTFAFLPSRSVLIAEGETEAMLLPTLLRESVNLANLPFQVAPGISNVSVDQASALRHEGSSVMYITDGDCGGKALQQKLLDAKVKKSDIVGLDEYFGVDCILEDLLDPDVYLKAINWVISTYQHNKPLTTAGDLTKPKRTDYLKTWCEENTAKIPDKVVVCQWLLDKKADAARRGDNLQLLDSAVKAPLAKLTKKLLKRFPASPVYGNT